MLLYPNFYLHNLLEITIPFLEKNQIQGLILDVDNTLIDYNKNLLEGTCEWVNALKQAGIKLCILSNSHNKKKVEKVAKQLEIPYLFFAKKPFKIGFEKAQKILKMKNEAIAVVGDQIFTDVFRCKSMQNDFYFSRATQSKRYFYYQI